MGKGEGEEEAHRKVRKMRRKMVRGKISASSAAKLRVAKNICRRSNHIGFEVSLLARFFSGSNTFESLLA
jgi:hypothetical protein